MIFSFQFEKEDDNYGNRIGKKFDYPDNSPNKVIVSNSLFLS